jgi:hypothetical protein
MSTEIVKAEKAERAYALYSELLARKRETAFGMIRLGEILSTIQAEKLYELMDCKTFEEFCGMPEVGFARSTVRLFITIYRLYIEKLGFDPKFISQIDVSKLQIINHRVADNPREAPELLHKAMHLSKSDLRDELRAMDGKPPKDITREVSDVGLIDYDTYEKFVKAHPCVVCQSRNVDAHHFPKTKGAGAGPYELIPLCRSCHSTYHNDPVDFIIGNDSLIFKYFYDTILKAYKIINNVIKGGK